MEDSMLDIYMEDRLSGLDGDQFEAADNFQADQERGDEDDQFEDEGDEDAALDDGRYETEPDYGYDVEDGRYDDDPNPYDGNYSEE